MNVLSSTELRKAISEMRRYMRENGIKTSSFMNGGHSAESYRCNAELFRLKVKLDKLNEDCEFSPTARTF